MSTSRTGIACSWSSCIYVPIGPQGHHDHPTGDSGVRRYWRWKSRSLGGRPQVDADLRALIQRVSAENPLWGASRIHGELLKLGFEIAQSSVAKYMVKRSWPIAADR